MIDTELIKQTGLDINGLVIQMIDSSELTLEERWSCVKPLILSSLSGSNMVMNFDEDSECITVTKSVNPIADLYYLLLVLSGKAYVIKFED